MLHPLPCPQDLEQLPNEDANLLPELQQLENTLSGCAKEASKDQVFMRMGYMASELKRLASKVHKNEQRTSFLQVSDGSSFPFIVFGVFFFPTKPLLSTLRWTPTSMPGLGGR